MDWNFAESIHALVRPILVLGGHSQPDVWVWPVWGEHSGDVLLSLRRYPEYVLAIRSHHLPGIGSVSVRHGVIKEHIRKWVDEYHLWGLPAGGVLPALVDDHLTRFQLIPSS